MNSLERYASYQKTDAEDAGTYFRDLLETMQKEAGEGNGAVLCQSLASDRRFEEHPCLDPATFAAVYGLLHEREDVSGWSSPCMPYLVRMVRPEGFLSKVKSRLGRPLPERPEPWRFADCGKEAFPSYLVWPGIRVSAADVVRQAAGTGQDRTTDAGEMPAERYNSIIDAYQTAFVHCTSRVQGDLNEALKKNRDAMEAALQRCIEQAGPEQKDSVRRAMQEALSREEKICADMRQDLYREIAPRQKDIYVRTYRDAAQFYGSICQISRNADRTIASAAEPLAENQLPDSASVRKLLRLQKTMQRLPESYEHTLRSQGMELFVPEEGEAYDGERHVSVELVPQPGRHYRVTKCDIPGVLRKTPQGEEILCPAAVYLEEADGSDAGRDRNEGQN